MESKFAKGLADIEATIRDLQAVRILQIGLTGVTHCFEHALARLIVTDLKFSIGS